MYGLLESQFRATFERAERQKGITGSNLLSMLERRLDNVAYRSGYANSRAEARQLVRHGHFTVNGKKVNIPSFMVSKNDVVEVLAASKSSPVIVNALEAVKRREIPQWLELDATALKTKVRDLPSRDDVTAPMEERLVVELYSK
jgi:small subunit ribosomal protein S4